MQTSYIGSGNSFCMERNFPSPHRRNRRNPGAVPSRPAERRSSPTLWSLTDMVRVIEDRETARAAKISGRVMAPELFTAERYRQEAMRVRRAGMAMHDEWVRQGMFSVADQYDGLAEFVEKGRFPYILLQSN